MKETIKNNKKIIIIAIAIILLLLNATFASYEHNITGFIFGHIQCLKVSNTLNINSDISNSIYLF